MDVCIFGSREFDNYELLEYALDEYGKKHRIDTIISGCAKGADSLGELYAEKHNIKIDKNPADWGRFGKSAGYRRNNIMAKKCDSAIAFWDGESKGTKHMIDYVKSLGKPCYVIEYKDYEEPDN